MRRSLPCTNGVQAKDQRVAEGAEAIFLRQRQKKRRLTAGQAPYCGQTAVAYGAFLSSFWRTSRYQCGWCLCAQDLVTQPSTIAVIVPFTHSAA